MFSTTFIIVIVALSLFPLVAIFYSFSSSKSYANNTVFFFTWFFAGMALAVVVLSFAQLNGRALSVGILVGTLVIMQIAFLAKTTSASSDDASWNLYETFSVDPKGLPKVDPNTALWCKSGNCVRRKHAASLTGQRLPTVGQGPCITADNKSGVYIPSLYGPTCIAVEDLNAPAHSPEPDTKSLGCKSAMHYDATVDADLAAMDAECQRLSGDDAVGLYSASSRAECRAQCPQNEEKCSLAKCAPNYYKGNPIHLTKCLAPSADFDAACAADYGPDYGFKEFSQKKCLTNGTMGVCEPNYYKGIKNATAFSATRQPLDKECATLYPPKNANDVVGPEGLPVVGVREYIEIGQGRKALCSPNYHDTKPIQGPLTKCIDIVYKSPDEQCKEHIYNQGLANSHLYAAKQVVHSCENPYEARLVCGL